MEGDILLFQSVSGKFVLVFKKFLEKVRVRLMENFEVDVDILLIFSVDILLILLRQEIGVVFLVYSQKRKLDEIKISKKQKIREVEDANEYENLILLDDFFDEMEIFNKKIKMENGIVFKILLGSVYFVFV